MIEVKIAMALLVHEIDMELTQGQSFRDVHSITMGLKDGLYVKLKTRDKI